MIDIRAGLRSRLLDNAGLSALVGGSRVYSIRLPQNIVAPSIVFASSSGQGDHVMSGPSGLSRPRVQIDCWSQSPDIAARLSRYVKTQLDGFSGAVSALDETGTEAVAIVDGILFESEREDYDGESALFRSSLDFFVWYSDVEHGFFDVVTDTGFDLTTDGGDLIITG